MRWSSGGRTRRRSARRETLGGGRERSGGEQAPCRENPSGHRWPLGSAFHYGMLLGDVPLQPREVTSVLVVGLPQRLRRRPSHLGIAIVQGSREPGNRGRNFHLAQPLDGGEADLLVVVVQPVGECLHRRLIADVGEGLGGGAAQLQIL